MRGLLDDRKDHVRRRRSPLVCVCPDMAAAVPGKAEIQSRSRRAVDFAGRDVVAHAVDLIVGEPEDAVGRIEVQADAVANAAREDLPLPTVTVEAEDAADARGFVERQLFRRWHVVGLADGHVEPAVGPDTADTGGYLYSG